MTVRRGHGTTHRWAAMALAGAAIAATVGATAPVAAAPVPPAAAADRAAAADYIDPSIWDPYEVHQAWDTLLNPYDDQALVGGSTAACTPGTTSSTYRGIELAAVNAMRSLAGAPALTEDPALTTQAQSAALLMAANGAVDADPPPTWACHTPAAATAAASSNLTDGAAGAAAQRRYLAEPDPGDVSAPHRRRLLCPSTRTTGFGDFGGYNATWTADPAPGPWQARNDIVAWPNPGLVPVTEAELFGLLDLWSFQVPPGHQTAAATVGITPISGGGGAVTAQVHPAGPADACGGAVTWGVSRAPAAGERWFVVVGGLVSPEGETYDSGYLIEFVETIAGVPKRVEGVTAVAGDGHATVSWSPTVADGGTLDFYAVTPVKDGTPQPPVMVEAPATATTLTGLTNGSSYTFTVKAFAHAGASTVWGSTDSAPSAAVVPLGPPGVPTAVTATAVDGRATVRWTAPTDTGGRPITGYVIRRFAAGSLVDTTHASGPQTTATVRNLLSGVGYTFTVAAVNAVGTGAPSAVSGVVETVAGHLPFASWKAFVTRQYQDLTGRAPANGTRDRWATDLGDGYKAKGDLIEALRRGSDNIGNADPVARLYRAFLGRTPDAGGLSFWVGRKRAGTWSVTRMADSFASSSEFKRTYGALSNRAFVTRIYTDVLGRTADAAGVTYWTKKLDTRARTRGSVMVGFSESNEYKVKQAENTDVAVAYTFLLGRAPNSIEEYGWVQRQKAGTPQATLATELLDSEYYDTHITG